MTYYETYSKCTSEEEIITKALQDTKIAIFLGNNPDRIKAIEDAMNNAIADKQRLMQQTNIKMGENRSKMIEL